MDARDDAWRFTLAANKLRREPLRFGGFNQALHSAQQGARQAVNCFHNSAALLPSALQKLFFVIDFELVQWYFPRGAALKHGSVFVDFF